MTALSIVTTRRIEARDVTEQIEPLAAESDGLLLVSTPHTTAALLLNEGDGPLLLDIERTAGGLLMPLEPYAHARNDNPNAAAHIVSSMFGSQCMIEARGGRLALGTYQRVLFLELDGPRDRTIEVRTIGTVR